MATITKKELIDQISTRAHLKRGDVKEVVHLFLEGIVEELGKGNRIEFRDFGVFEIKVRKPRQAQNPKTLEPVAVPARRTVKFKVGRLMKEQLHGLPSQPMEVVVVSPPDGKKATRRSGRDKASRPA